VAALQEIDVPLLIVGGEKDNVTNPDMARTLHEKAASPSKNLVIVEDGSHNELYEAASYRSAYRALVDSVITGATASEVARNETAERSAVSAGEEQDYRR